MDSFSNYPEDERFDPFSLMLFKALQVVAFLFIIALLAINPEAKTGAVDLRAELLITMNWPDNHPDDLDLYVEDPAGNIVWYHQREAGFMTLDRDDRGGANDFILVGGRKIISPIRQEMVTVHNVIPGEYIVNVHHYLAKTNQPVPVSVKVEKLNPTTQIIYYGTEMMERAGEERTYVRFVLAEDGSVTDIRSVPERSLIQQTRVVKPAK